MNEIIDKNPRRQIRSFVRRQGRISDSQKRAFQELYAVYGLDPAIQITDLNEVFKRSAPKILEIGFGMGHALLEMARQCPQNDYLGIEVHKPGVGMALDQIAKDQLTNLRLICEDAMKVLENGLPDHAFAKIFVLFPDPWHKKRHQKRRLIQVSFIELLARKLETRGVLHIATDWEDYAEHIAYVFAQTGVFVPSSPEMADLRPMTKYENRGLRLGHKIRDFVYTRI